ncbi:unnamed protein product (macronuclear) [Paramecium tetraurelia]|uniref:Uncharacterized protein n=1 Tax=Paramecium tetraurelia TaxID=5888 RepID=A0E930_PARTE|nr:uncharacterized protein GSPATT00024528001 [Paramecium tetraurelia]CAK91797.1 unnamed protein product [Paramecium tetraurelia]|eukprot:XP_001459194.1 hypothetical protein (macronuclear) [Paramecium tetraurelia strain d4-2]
MSKQSSFLANPLNDSSNDFNAKGYISDNQSNSGQDVDDCPKNPLESDNEGNESAVLQHLIDNEKEDSSSRSDGASNPMMEMDPVSLENVINQNFASIGQQYHVCQTIVDCNKTIELQQDQNPLYSCDELLDPRQSNKEKSKDIIKNFESQLQQLQKENQLLKVQLIEKDMNFSEKAQLKDKELANLNELNKNLNAENVQMKGEMQKYKNEIQSLTQKINQLQAEKLKYHRSKTGAETTRGYDVQVLIKQFKGLQKGISLNDQTITATLSANHLEIRKIPTTSIDIPCPFSAKQKQDQRNQFAFKNGKPDTNHLITEQCDTQRLRKGPKNQRSLQDLIYKAQIGIAFSRPNSIIAKYIIATSLQKAQGLGQLFFESKSARNNQQQTQLVPKQ